MFNRSMGHFFISKYLLFIGYIENALTVNFHSIFTIVKSQALRSPMTTVPVKVLKTVYEYLLTACCLNIMETFIDEFGV